MSDLQIREASAAAMLALVAVQGPPGAGKSLGALLLAHGLGGRIVVVDTETRADRRGVLRGRSETYLGLCDATTGGTPLKFDVLPLAPPFTVERYTQALELAWSKGYDVVICDSLTHEWFGILEEVDAKGGGFQGAWKTVSPKHERFIDRIMRSPSHLICTMRTKMAYEVVDDEKGRKAPRKIGLQPLQRDGVEYQFEVVFDVTAEHTVILSKANANYGQRLADYVRVKPRLTAELGQRLATWLAGDQPAAAGQRLTEVVAQIEPDPTRLPEALRPDPVLPQAGPTAPGSDQAAVDDAALFTALPEKLAEAVLRVPVGGNLTNEETRDVHLELVYHLGGGEAGKVATTAAWSAVGVTVQKGAVVTREQAIGAVRAALRQPITT